MKYGNFVELIFSILVAILDSSGVIVSEKFCLNNNIHIGDYITIESQDGIKKDVLVIEVDERNTKEVFDSIKPNYVEKIFSI